MSAGNLHITRRVTPGIPASVQHAHLLQKRAPHVKNSFSSKPHRHMLQMLSDRFACLPSITCENELNNLCAASSASTLFRLSPDNEEPPPWVTMAHDTDLHYKHIVTETPKCYSGSLDNHVVNETSSVSEENVCPSAPEEQAVEVESVHDDIRPCYVLLSKLDDDYISIMTGESRIVSVKENTDSFIANDNDDALPDIVYTPTKRKYGNCNDTDTLSREMSARHQYILKKWRALLPERREGSICDDLVQCFKSTRDKLQVGDGEANDNAVDTNLHENDSPSDRKCDAEPSEQEDALSGSWLDNLEINFKLLSEVVDEFKHAGTRNYDSVATCDASTTLHDNGDVHQKNVCADSSAAVNDDDNNIKARCDVISVSVKVESQLPQIPSVTTVNLPPKSSQSDMAESKNSVENFPFPPEPYRIHSSGWRIPKLKKAYGCVSSMAPSRPLSTMKRADCRKSRKELSKGSPRLQVVAPVKVQQKPVRKQQGSHTHKRHFTDEVQRRPLSVQKQPCVTPKSKKKNTASPPRRLPSFRKSREHKGSMQNAIATSDVLVHAPVLVDSVPDMMDPDKTTLQSSSLQPMVGTKQVPQRPHLLTNDGLICQYNQQMPPTSIGHCSLLPRDYHTFSNLSLSRPCAEEAALDSFLEPISVEQSRMPTNSQQSKIPTLQHVQGHAHSNITPIQSITPHTIQPVHTSASYIQPSQIKTQIAVIINRRSPEQSVQPSQPLHNSLKTVSPQLHVHKHISHTQESNTMVDRWPGLPTESVEQDMSLSYPMYPHSSQHDPLGLSSLYSSQLLPQPVRSVSFTEEPSRIAPLPKRKRSHSPIIFHERPPTDKAWASTKGGHLSNPFGGVQMRELVPPNVPEYKRHITSESKFNDVLMPDVGATSNAYAHLSGTRAGLDAQLPTKLVNTTTVVPLIQISHTCEHSKNAIGHHSHSSHENFNPSMHPKERNVPHTANTGNVLPFKQYHTMYESKSKDQRTNSANTYNPEKDPLKPTIAVIGKPNVANANLHGKPPPTADHQLTLQKKNSGAGKFHGRTLLSGEGVPTRQIPLQPLYLLHPIRQSGRPEVIPIDPRPTHYCRKRKMMEAEQFRRRLEKMNSVATSSSADDDDVTSMSVDPQVVEVHLWRIDKRRFHKAAVKPSDELQYAPGMNHQRAGKQRRDNGKADRICNDDMDLDSN